MKALTKRDLLSIDRFIVHCSDSDYAYHDDISVINKWHMERGWVCVGYHFFIKKNGEVQYGRPIKYVGAHCKSFNHNSIGICLSGSTMFDPITQYKALRVLFKQLLIAFGLFSVPRDTFKIFHHRDLNPHKTCPNFDLDRDANIYVPKRQKDNTDYLSDP